MTPLRVLLFGVSPLTAVGTDLLYAAAKCGGVLVQGLNGTLGWRLAADSIPATAATILVLVSIGAKEQGRHGFISSVLGAALVLTALAIVSRHHLVRRLTPLISRLSDRGLTWLTITFGAVLGVVVSVSSIGAGAAGVTVLMILYPGTPLVRLIGADIAHAVTLTLIAGSGTGISAPSTGRCSSARRRASPSPASWRAAPRTVYCARCWRRRSRRSGCGWRSEVDSCRDRISRSFCPSARRGPG